MGRDRCGQQFLRGCVLAQRGHDCSGDHAHEVLAGDLCGCADSLGGGRAQLNSLLLLANVVARNNITVAQYVNFFAKHATGSNVGMQGVVNGLVGFFQHAYNNFHVPP